MVKSKALRLSPASSTNCKVRRQPATGVLGFGPTAGKGDASSLDGRVRAIGRLLLAGSGPLMRAPCGQSATVEHSLRNVAVEVALPRTQGSRRATWSDPN